LFRTQIRALLRAARFGNLAILLPMVSDADELRRAKQIIAEIRNELGDAGEAPLLGCMVETPAAALLAQDLAGEAGFLSIGTNDLTQYVLAVDRLNQHVNHLYQPFHPAVLRLIREVAEAARRNGKRVAICGEMAADSLAVPLFVGMGLDELSMSPSSIPLVRDLIRRLSKLDAEALVADTLKLKSASQVIEQLRRFAPRPCSPEP
jgi:phosphotransferase system enzyme I (PtsI)